MCFVLVAQASLAEAIRAVVLARGSAVAFRQKFEVSFF